MNSSGQSRTAQCGLSLIECARSPGDQWEKIAFLIEAGANLEDEGRGAVAAACEQDNPKVLEALLRAGVPVKQQPNGDAPVFEALFWDSADCFDVLIKHGASLDDLSPSGLSCLMYAVESQAEMCVERLLMAGADPNRHDRFRTPLIMAAARSSKAIVSALLKYGAKDGQERPALREAVKNTEPGALEAFLDAGHIVSGYDEYDISLAGIACLRHDVRMLSRLHTAGVDLDFPSKDGSTGLLYAAAKNKVDTVRFLIEIGCNVNTLSQAMTAPASGPARNGHLESFVLLVEAGADLSVKNDRGLSIEDLATDRCKAYLAAKKSEQLILEAVKLEAPAATDLSAENGPSARQRRML